MKEEAKSSKSYSQVIKEFRDLTGWNQTQVGRAVGVRQKTVSDWETGKSSGRYFLAGVRFAFLALKLGLSLEDLILAYPDPGDTDGKLTGVLGEVSAGYECE
jgi:transcriptional regulator with XRE-family HTH domain